MATDDGWVTIAPGSAPPAARGDMDWQPVPATPAAETPQAEPAPASWRDYFMLGSNAASFGLGNRAVAAKRALTGEAPSYSEALAELARGQEQVRRQHPFLAGSAEAAGGLATGLGLAGAGVTLAGRGSTLAQRAGAGAAEGGLLGGAQGAGMTYSDKPEDYAKAAGMGAVFGGGIGGAVPAVGSALGAGVRAADQALARMYGGYPGSLQRAAEADAAGLRALRGDLNALLPDAGPSMRQAAQSAMTTGGGGRSALEGALRAREQATPYRITGEIDQTFGPATTPSVSAEGVRERMRQLGSEYDRILLQNGRAVDTRGIANELEALAINSRGPARNAMREVRAMLDVEGNPGVLDPDPRVLQQTRTAVRGMAETAEDPNAERLLNQAYGRITNELHAKVPGMRELDSQYLELGTQERALGPTSPGSRIFETGRTTVIRPDEMQRTLAEAGAPKGTMQGPSGEPMRLREAARAELERIVGGSKNDLLKLENTLGKPTDWNYEKLAIVFGRDKADRLMNVLERERTYRNTYQKVVEGSKTAETLEGALDQKRDRLKIPHDATLFGATTRGLEWAANKMYGAARSNTRDEIARLMATRDPVLRDQIIDQLLTTSATRSQRGAAIQDLVDRSLTPAIPALGPTFKEREKKEKR